MKIIEKKTMTLYFYEDCYLGIALSFIRLIKAGVLHVIYMARVDCSFFGRSLETCGKNSH